MTHDEMVKKAPSGATHYNKYERYFKVDSVGFMYAWVAQKWKPLHATIRQSKGLIKL